LTVLSASSDAAWFPKTLLRRTTLGASVGAATIVFQQIAVAALLPLTGVQPLPAACTAATSADATMVTLLPTTSSSVTVLGIAEAAGDDKSSVLADHEALELQQTRSSRCHRLWSQ
jgi:hypothetical protein